MIEMAISKNKFYPDTPKDESNFEENDIDEKIIGSTSLVESNKFKTLAVYNNKKLFTDPLKNSAKEGANLHDKNFIELVSISTLSVHKFNMNKYKHRFSEDLDQYSKEFK